MRPLLTLIFLLKIGLSLGQSFAYPTIKNNGHKLSEFIPNGWTILDSTSEDLNNDKHDDFACVLEHRDSVSIFSPSM